MPGPISLHIRIITSILNHSDTLISLRSFGRFVTGPYKNDL